MIHVKVLGMLDSLDRNIKWLSDKTDINYSTLYNFVHEKTNAVSYEMLDKLCFFFQCNLTDILQHESLSQQRSDTHDITKKTNMFPMMDWKSKSDIKDSDS